jgi:hypothetical protein
MKVVRRREEPNGSSGGGGAKGAGKGGSTASPGTAAAPSPQPAAAPKILFRAAGPAAPAAPKVSKEEAVSRKVAKLLGQLEVAYCDGSVDVVAAVEAAGFAALQVPGWAGTPRDCQKSSWMEVAGSLGVRANGEPRLQALALSRQRCTLSHPPPNNPRLTG